MLNKCKKALEDLESVTYPININIVESSQKNAFALPGGHIYIYSGLLENIKNEDELFSLLLHEVGHIERRHGLKRILRATIIGSILSALIQDISGVSAIIAENSSLLLELSYNRDEEFEADLFAYTEAENLGIKNSSLSDLFSRVFLDSNSVLFPEFLSTHPDTEDRIKRLESFDTTIKTQHILSDLEFKILTNNRY